MAKCGHDICPDDNCGLLYLLNGGRRYRCRRIQQCFEDRCSSLKTLGPSGFALYDACLGHCHRVENDPTYPENYASINQYLCANFDPVTLVDYFGVNVCGVPEEQTQVYQQQQAEVKNSATTRKYLGVIAGVIVVLLLIFLVKD